MMEELWDHVAIASWSPAGHCGAAERRESRALARSEHRFDQARGKGALVPIAPGFLRWKGTAHTMRSGKGSGN
jgi:hypothetical protein